MPFWGLEFEASFGWRVNWQQQFNNILLEEDDNDLGLWIIQIDLEIKILMITIHSYVNYLF